MIRQLYGIIIEGAIYQNSGNHVMTETLKATDFAKIKKLIAAGKVLNMEVDIVGVGYGTWEDTNGDAIFSHDILLQLRGKKYHGDPEATGKLEQLIPTSSSTINLRFFRER